ncbi:MAG: helix-turn-helix domain-containing protein [Pseudonocardiaceae bacterium]
MAFRRQRLSQRRKAVGFTQESLAERLGVERSTIVRWEAGDTQPLPSIRPSLASALQVSLDQLVELLTKTEDAVTTRSPSADTEVMAPVLLPEVRSQLQPGEAELHGAIRPQEAEDVETLRRTLRSADVDPEYFDAMLLVCGVSAVPLVTQLLSDEHGGSVAVHSDHQAASVAPDITLAGPATDTIQVGDIDTTTSTDLRLDTLVPATVAVAGVGGSDVPDPTPIEASASPPLTTEQPHWAKSRRFTRFAAAGVLVLAGAAASVPLVSSHQASIPPAAAGTTAPAAPELAIRAPGQGSSQDLPGVVPPAPVAGPGEPADGLAPPAVAAPPTTKVANGSRPTSRSKSPAAATPPPPRTPEIPAEAQAWSQRAALLAGNQRNARLHPQFPSRP